MESTDGWAIMMPGIIIKRAMMSNWRMEHNFGLNIYIKPQTPKDKNQKSKIQIPKPKFQNRNSKTEIPKPKLRNPNPKPQTPNPWRGFPLFRTCEWNLLCNLYKFRIVRNNFFRTPWCWLSINCSKKCYNNRTLERLYSLVALAEDFQPLPITLRLYRHHLLLTCNCTLF